MNCPQLHVPEIKIVECQIPKLVEAEAVPESDLS